VSRRRHRLIACLLALALLGGQLGAQAHAYSHLLSDPLGVPANVESCGKCLSFAPLLTAVGGSPGPPLAVPREAERIAPLSPALVPSHPAHPAFQPRGPPTLL